MIKHITLILLLVLCSCTVTKRMHRKGFNVEWHKSYVSNNSTNEQKDTKFEDNKLNDEVVSSSNEVGNITEIEVNDEVELSVVEVEDPRDEFLIDDEVKLEDSPLVIKRYSHSYNEELPYAPFSSNEEPNVAEEDSGDEILAFLAIFILVLGILLILGSLFLIFGFPSNTGLFSALVLSGNGLVAGIFGFLLYLLIMVLIILFVLLIQFVLGTLVGLILGFSLIIAGIILLIIFR
jgi:hypothetical protein